MGLGCVDDKISRASGEAAKPVCCIRAEATQWRRQRQECLCMSRDASKGMVQRAKRNAALSGIPGDRIRYIVDDCLKFMDREIRRGNRYDAVIADPPSYGRGAGGEVWQMNDMADTLVSRMCSLLSDKPLFIILNSYTSGLSPSACGCLLTLHARERFGKNAVCDELGLPVTEKGICLPCGSTARIFADNI